jgi:ubiquinone biosynthesis protein UbiJ
MRAPAEIPARIVNRALAHEDALRGKLAAHAGATFRIVVGGAGATLAIDADGALRAAAQDAAPALTLTLRARDVAPLLHDPSRFDALVHADGDPALAATLKDLCATIPWFVERLFGDTFGAIVGQRLADAGRRMLGFPDEAATRLATGVRDYLGDEAPLATARADAGAFGDEVAAIASRVDALAARIDELAGRAR